MSSAALESLKPEVDAFSEKLAAVQREVGRVVVGQQYMVERLLLALIADGHILLEGLPGLAKTTAVKTLAGVVQTDFSRISFTPDLLPADVIGTEITARILVSSPSRRDPSLRTCSSPMRSTARQLRFKVHFSKQCKSAR